MRMSSIPLIPQIPHEYLITMRIKIDRSRCAGCGVCSETLPSIFYLNGYHAVVTGDSGQILNDNEVLARRIQESAASCPLNAISLRSSHEQSE